MPRVLAIDYGDRRIGLAISDPLGIAAQGLPTLENRSAEHVIGALGELVAKYSVDEIVVGLPLNMDGSEGEQAAKVRAFADRLRSLGTPVHFVDERLTTERAKRTMREAGLSREKRIGRTDRLAAQFILQAYLARQGKDSEESRHDARRGQG